MQPFGVRVITVISGAVESKVFQNGAPLQLPENSFYTPAQKEIAERAAGKDTEKVAPVKVDDYARTLVGDILGGAHGKVYRGRSATLVSFLSGWMPTFLFVSCPVPLPISLLVLMVYYRTGFRGLTQVLKRLRSRSNSRV